MEKKHEWEHPNTWCSNMLETHPLKARMLKALGRIGDIFNSPDQETDVNRIDAGGLGVNVNDEKNQKYWYLNVFFSPTKEHERWMVENIHISGLRPSQDVLKTSTNFDPKLFELEE